MNEPTSPTNPIAEAVRGYMRDRSRLIEYRMSLSLSEDQKKSYTQDISVIDEKVKELIAMDNKTALDKENDAINEENRRRK